MSSPSPLFRVPLELLLNHIAAFLDYDSYATLRQTCRQMARVLRVRGEVYYTKQCGLRVLVSTNPAAQLTMRVFYCNKRQCGARADGPFTIIVQHFDGQALKPHERNPVACNACRRFFLAQEGDVAVEREWANYTMAPTREAALLSREIRVRLKNDACSRVVHREYRNQDGRLHRMHGPAWFCYLDPPHWTRPCAYVEEYWHQGEPRVGSDGWRLQYDDRGALREKWCRHAGTLRGTHEQFDRDQNVSIRCEYAHTRALHRARDAFC